MTHFFGLLAGLVGLAGYIPYIRDILKRTTKPDRPSWLIWTLEYGVLFLAQLAKGASGSLWLVGLQFVGVVVVYVLSFRYGIGGFDRRNMLLIGCVCLALILWYATQDASAAIFIALAVEACGVALTAIKVYKHPGSETLTMWVLVGVAGILGVAAVESAASAILFVYPISLIIMSSSVVVAALLGARKTQVPILSLTTPPEDQ